MWKRHKNAKMSRNLGICNVWATSQESTSSIILGSQIWVQNVVDKGAAFCSTSNGFLKIPVRWDVQMWPFRWFSIGFTYVSWKLILDLLGPRRQQGLVAPNTLWKQRNLSRSEADFDSDGGFKGKVSAEDDVVGKVQNDEF